MWNRIRIGLREQEVIELTEPDGSHNVIDYCLILASANKYFKLLHKQKTIRGI